MPANRSLSVAGDTFWSQGQVLGFLYLLLLFPLPLHFFLLEKKHFRLLLILAPLGSRLQQGDCDRQRDLGNPLLAATTYHSWIKHSHSSTCHPHQQAMHCLLHLCSTTTSRTIATMKMTPGSMHPLGNSRTGTTTGVRTLESRPQNAPSAATESANGAGSAQSSAAMSVQTASKRIQARGEKATSEGRCTGISITTLLGTG